MQNNVFKIEIIYEKIILQNVKHPCKFYSAPIPPRLKAGLCKYIPVTFKYPLKILYVFFYLTHNYLYNIYLNSKLLWWRKFCLRYSYILTNKTPFLLLIILGTHNSRVTTHTHIYFCIDLFTRGIALKAALKKGTVVCWFIAHRADITNKKGV